METDLSIYPILSHLSTMWAEYKLGRDKGPLIGIQDLSGMFRMNKHVELNRDFPMKGLVFKFQYL